MMQNKNIKNLTDNPKTLTSIGIIVVAAIMLISYIVALSKFNGSSDDINEPIDSSAVTEESVTVPDVSDKVSVEMSVPTDEYDYYDEIEFENVEFSNSAVVNGTLAIIKDGSNGFPAISDDSLVNIYSAKTPDVYQLSNVSLKLDSEAMTNFDKFIVAFYDAVPGNGLIINKGYTVSDAISEGDAIIDLVTGYSVQFALHHSPYSFSSTECSFLYDNAVRYGIIRRYPDNKEALTGFEPDYTIYRYVGQAHSLYMDHYKYCLEEYIDKIKTEKVIESVSRLDPSVAYVVYYVPMDASSNSTVVPVPQGDGYTYEISGDGSEGFIVTVQVSA